MWDPALLREVAAEFPDPDSDGWIRYADSDHEVKLEGGESLWGDSTRRLMAAISELGPQLSVAFGLPELHMRMEGGGYHHILPGGRLAVHADFNRSEEGLYRRLNVIIYLNEGWTEQDGGHLELWDECGKVSSVLPVFNRTVVFQTSDRSFHGHPVPLPGPRSRRSFAAYFFSAEPPADYEYDHTTVWLSDVVSRLGEA